MTEPLKPCHCKRRPCIHRACLNNETYQRFAVVCSCGMNTEYWESEKDAIEKWNNRPIEDDMVRLIQEIREGAEALIFANHRESDGKTIVDLCDDALALAKGGKRWAQEQDRVTAIQACSFVSKNYRVNL